MHQDRDVRMGSRYPGRPPLLHRYVTGTLSIHYPAAVDLQERWLSSAIDRSALLYRYSLSSVLGMLSFKAQELAKQAKQRELSSQDS